MHAAGARKVPIMKSGRVVIFTDDPGWHGKQLQLAFAVRGLQAEFVSLKACRLTLSPNTLPLVIPGFEDELPIAAFVRGVPGGSLEEVIFYLDILHALKLLDIPVYNDGRAVEKSVDKGMTSFLLRLNAINTPVTWVLNDREAALAIIEQELLDGHYVMSKPLFGSQGEGIRRLEKMIDQVWLTCSHGIYYLQRFMACAGQGFSDMRVYVINGKAIAAMRRKGQSWLNNVAQGAACEALVLEQEIAELAVKAAEALKMDYAGVDIIQAQDGSLWVLEVNSIPAWKGLQSVCQLNVAQLMVDDLLQRYLGFSFA